MYIELLCAVRQLPGTFRIPGQLNYINVAAIDVEHILSRCEPKERGLLEAYYIQGYRTKEIALERGCSEVAVGIRLYRARRTVMRLLCGPARALRCQTQRP